MGNLFVEIFRQTIEYQHKGRRTGAADRGAQPRNIRMPHFGQKHGFAGQVDNGIVVHVRRNLATESFDHVTGVSIIVARRMMDHPSLACCFFRGIIDRLVIARA
jgi:hypothetical protein